MNKNFWKRFLTWNPHHNDGFTLVELIVVIAILAILAAVAVPAYSGYIEKAKRAGDETLLNSLNKAFVSACNLNGADPYTLSKIPETIRADADGDGEITITGIKNIDEAIAKDFVTIFADNKNTEFKLIKNVVFNPYTRMFVDGMEKFTIQFGANNTNYDIKMETISGFMNSVFAENVEAMQGQLSGISGAFGEFVGNVEAAGVISPEFQQFMKDKGYGDDKVGNAAVLYVAQNAGNYTPQDVAQMFQDIADKNPQNMQDVLSTFEGEDALTNIALMYGAATAYANSEDGKKANPDLAQQLTEVNDGNSLLAAFGALNKNDDWSKYLGTAYDPEGDGISYVEPSETFTADMNGLLGAMDAVNTVSPDIKVDDTDFWQSEEVSDLLNSLLG